MKRFGLFFIMNLIFGMVQAENNDPHLMQLIECINDSNFVCASKELPLVGDWTYNPQSSSVRIHVDNAEIFNSYADSIGITRSSLENFLLCEAEEYNELAMNLCTQGNFLQSEKYHFRALEIRKELLGEEHILYAISLDNIGFLYDKKGDYKQAEKYYSLALSILKGTIGNDRSHYAISLDNMGNLLDKMGNYAEAEKFHLHALEIQKDIFGEKNKDYAISLYNLGIIYYKRGEFSKAETYYIQALNILKEVLGEKDLTYAIAINNLGVLYAAMGNLSRAEKSYSEALEIRKEVLGEDHPVYAISLGTIADIYTYMGDFSQAEKYYLRVMEIRKNVLGENHPDYSSALNNLGVMYSKIGDYEQAEKYILQALDIRKKVYGEKHTQYANSLNNLGVLYTRMGNYFQAVKCCEQAMVIQKDILGEKHPYYAQFLSNLAAIHEKMGNYEVAEKYYLQALDIFKEVYGGKHPEYAIALDNLGGLYQKESYHIDAEKCHLQALDIQKEMLGENHPDYAKTLNNLGTLYSNLGDYIKAESYVVNSQNINKKRFLQSLDFMSERQREAYWNSIKINYEQIYPLYIYHCQLLNPSISVFAYNNELFTKGLLLSSSNLVRESILESKNPVEISLWEELTEKKKQIITLEERNSKSTYLEQLRIETEQIEKQITGSSAAFRENQHQWKITWDSVRAALKPNQVAIEYMTIPVNEDSTMYCALLLRDTCSYPIMIPLFEEKEVSTLLETPNPLLIDKSYLYELNGKQLSQLVWGKVISYINPGEVIFFAPKGLLHQVAVESIPYDSTSIISDIYNMVRLSSTREIVLGKSYTEPMTATLYGGIQYDVRIDDMYAESIRYKQTASRSLDTDTTNRGSATYLPGTKKEIEQIQQMLNKQHIQIHALMCAAANEESFKALSGQKQNILHIATHGFYWSDSTALNQQYFSQRTPSMDNIDPLDRCGLLFAGANIALSGCKERLQEGVQDGVLTAKEISLLDLREADIVVLSACETGLGDVTGDGVFGLQRAFKMAGVRTILMSLWKVDDDATRVFMTSFYRNLCDGQSKREAFRNAQQEVRNYTGTADTETESIDRADAQDRFKNKVKPSNQNQSLQSSKKNQQKYPYRSPYYWAGFILLD